MLHKIESFEQIRHLSEIVLGNEVERNETYKIVLVDRQSIKMIRLGEFSRMRILPFENILEGEWFFDDGFIDFTSNTDGHLLKDLNKRHGVDSYSE